MMPPADLYPVPIPALSAVTWTTLNLPLRYRYLHIMKALGEIYIKTQSNQESIGPFVQGDRLDLDAIDHHGLLAIYDTVAETPKLIVSCRAKVFKIQAQTPSPPVIVRTVQPQGYVYGAGRLTSPFDMGSTIPNGACGYLRCINNMAGNFINEGENDVTLTLRVYRQGGTLYGHSPNTPIILEPGMSYEFSGVNLFQGASKTVEVNNDFLWCMVSKTGVIRYQVTGQEVEYIPLPLAGV